MRPLLLTLSAFGPYVEEIQIDFTVLPTSASFLIHGPTGAGKTTLLDAISFALFAVAADGVRTGKQLRCRQAPAEKLTVVSLTFKHGKETYRVYREWDRESPKRKAYLWDASEKLLATQWNKVTEAIESILGMRSEQFRQVVILPQGQFQKLLLATSNERQDILETLFQTETFRTLEEILKQKAADAQQGLEKLFTQKEWLLKQVEEKELNQVKEALKKLQDSQVVAEERIQKLRRDEEIWQTRYNELRHLHEKKKQREGWERALKTLEKPQFLKIESAKKALPLQPLEEQCRRLSQEETRLLREIKLLLAKEEVFKKEFTEHKEFPIQALLEEKGRLEQTKESIGNVSMQSKKDKKKLLEKIEEELIGLKKQCEQVENDWATHLSGLLKEGEPCLVCGSTTHPKQVHADHAPQGSLTTLLQFIERKNEEKQTLLAEMKDDEKRHSLEQIEKRLQEVVKLVTYFQQEHKKRLDAQEQYAICKNHLQNYKQQLKNITEEKVSQETHFIALLQENTFTLETYQTAKMPLELLEKLIQEKEEIVSQRKHLLEQLKQSEHCEKLLPIEGIKKEGDQLHREKEELLTAMASLKEKIKKYQGLIQDLECCTQEEKILREKFGVLGHLAPFANGKNAQGLSFHRFVLGTLFEEVLVSATTQLQIMTQRRYSFQRALEREDQRTRGGLDCEVFDAYSGFSRSLTTLSGGESFIAALALALGLVDVVQRRSGGMSLDTFFIDEGFGNLDPQALDNVLEVIQNLGNEGKCIGIISHVPEMKERIPYRLEVTSTGVKSFSMK